MVYDDDGQVWNFNQRRIVLCEGKLSLQANVLQILASVFDLKRLNIAEWLSHTKTNPLLCESKMLLQENVEIEWRSLNWLLMEVTAVHGHCRWMLSCLNIMEPILEGEEKGVLGWEFGNNEHFWTFTLFIDFFLNFCMCVRPCASVAGYYYILQLQYQVCNDASASNCACTCKSAGIGITSERRNSPTLIWKVRITKDLFISMHALKS